MSDGISGLRCPARSSCDATCTHGGEGVLELAKDRKRRLEPGQVEDVANLRVLPLWKQERETEQGSLGPEACTEQHAERRRVDEGGIAEIDHDALSFIKKD
jgi:hypothetical protein